MNPLIQLKITTPLFFIIVALTSAKLLPEAQAVEPAPDGGYVNWNTAEGSGALFSINGGTFNTAIGGHALYENTTGISNTAVGAFALTGNSQGSENVAVGQGALRSSSNASGNVAVGYQALYSNTSGSDNTASGTGALKRNTSGDENTAVGRNALGNNGTGSYNTATGYSALRNNTAGLENTAIGVDALANNSTGTFNIALGVGAGAAITTANGVICIGTSGANVGDSCFIGNIRDVSTQNADALPVVIDSAGQLGTMSSSKRFKKEIKPMDTASESIFALKPVTFHYKSDTKDTPQFGLIAEEVAEVNPDLVVRNKDGEIYTVRYEAVNAMLLNEFLKEHRKVEDLEANAARQQKQIEALTAGLQKMSAQLEASKPAPQVVNNP